MRLTGRRCQCAACGKVFSVLSAFDRHRTGEYGGGRRCMTTEEMLAKGFGMSGSVWRQESGRHPGFRMPVAGEAGKQNSRAADVLATPLP